MESIIIENFRCFKKEHNISLKPLTILVGENSTGKTSFLAAISIIADFNYFYPGEIDFNREPYSLGAYNEIASYSLGKSGRAKYFIIGKDFVLGDQRKFRMLLKFISVKGQPKLEKISIKEMQTDNNMDVTVADDCVEIAFPDGKLQEKRDIPYSFMYILRQFGHHFKSKELESAIDMHHPRIRLFPSAPVRTRPRRTYDPKQDFPKPEGDHVPQRLHDIYTNKEKNKAAINELDTFGRASGLYKSLGVTAYGGETGPFRINVKISGNSRNILDVGYGVSQVLPIIVDTLGSRSGLFLLQQPEIHLHPKAQAELGSYFGKLVKSTQKRVILETHSDYLLDRIRFDLRDKVNGLTPDDVKLLFFHRKQNHPWVDIHEIYIDENGELINPPDEYREFFTGEQMRLFNIKE